MKFKLPYLKLSALYVLIIMVISIIFSVILYQISSNEYGKGFGRQAKMMQNLSFDSPIIKEMEKLRNEQINDFNNRLIFNLFLFNTAILIISAFLSYYLAQKHMQPIEQALEAQSQFTADASHELRTPLTAMKTEIEVAMRDKLLNISDAKKLLKSNLEEIEKLEYLSSSLLKLARSENNHKQFQNLLLNEAIEKSIKGLTPVANKKSIIIKAKLLKTRILGDESSLVEMFTIILENAIKYSDKGKTVHVQIVKEKEKVLVKIKDQGMGIKSSEIPYIFNRFYRADISRSKEKVFGYGLGLSIAKKIADSHHVSISVSSVLGKGTEFTIIF